jgi:uncharacterized protein YoxC
MNTIIFGVMAGVVVLLAAVLVPLVLELRRMVAALRQTTEKQLNPALEELRVTLKSIKSITDNVNVITEDVRQLSGALQHAGQKISAVNAAVDSIASSLTIRTLSLKAGIKTALLFLIANLTRKGERS